MNRREGHSPSVTRRGPRRRSALGTALGIIIVVLLGPRCQRGPTEERTTVPAAGPSSRPAAVPAAGPSSRSATVPAAGASSRPATLVPKVRALRLAELRALEPGASLAEVERRFGEGMTAEGMAAEGPVLVYPLRGATAAEAWFWFFPRDPRQRQDRWLKDELRCAFVSAGGNASESKVVWPKRLRGRSIDVAVESIRGGTAPR